MIVLHATFPVDPAKWEDARELIEELVAQSNQEPGMIEYRATHDLVDDHVIRFFEQYEDEDALSAHTETEHFQRFEEQLPELLDGEPEVKQFEVEDVTEPEV